MKLLSIAFHLFILIKYTYQSCGIITTLGDMTPVELDIEVNSDIVFNCTLHPTSGYNSSSIFFSFINQDIPQSHIQIIDNLTAQLTLRNVKVNQSGRYHCKVINEKEGRKPLVCLSEARVGYKPADLPVSDFSCKYLYRKEMRCSWTKPHNKINTQTNLSEYKHAIRGFENICPSLHEHNDRMTCIWSRNTFHRATYNPKYHYALTQSNILGKHEQYYTFNLSSVVQLDPPPNLTFHRELNTLSWDYPNLIDNDNNLFHLLQFKVVVNEICTDVCDESEPKVFTLGNTQKNLTLDLKPYMLYNFSVSCKVDDHLNDYWSDSTWILNRTKEDAPSSPPVLIRQAFETSSTNPRSATIYWQSLPSNLANSPEVEYLVGLVDLKTKVQSNITTVYRNHTFDTLKPTSYEFRIYSKNFIGLSKDYSSIILPESSDILRSPNKIAVIDDKFYTIEWEKSDLKSGVQDYTIFWCLARNDYCIEDLKWESTVDNYYRLKLPKYNHYKFGISANTQHSSSGIYWTHCIVNPNLNVDKLRTLHPFPHSSTSILIKWDFLCEAQKKQIRDLKIEYCPKDDCVPQQKRTFNVTNLSTDQSLVTGLAPNTTYLFTVSSANIAQESQVEGTTDLSVPLSPFDLAIVDSSGNMTTIQWNFTSTMVDHFRVKAPFLQKEIDLGKESCEGSEHCLYTLIYSQPLNAYFNYSISVSSCNIKGDCSNSSEVYFQTAPSKPGKMLVPIVEKLSSSKYRIHFRKPLQANGPINFYYVRQQQHKEVKRYGGGESSADLTVECEHTIQTEPFKVQIYASNLVNGEELKGEPSDWVSIDLCKISGTLYILIVTAFIFCIVVIIGLYCAFGYMNSLKMKKKSFQINIQCNQRDTDVSFAPYEKDNLVHPEENELNHIIADRRKISSSVTNASMTSDSSIAENSHSSDKNCPSSSSDNCYASDSTANYSDINYRENHEYFLNPMDDSCRPLMGPSTETETETETVPETTTTAGLRLDMDKASEMNKSPVTYVPSSSQIEQKPVAKAVYVPLSPIMQTPASPPANCNSNSHYVSHAFAAQQNLKNSTIV